MKELVVNLPEKDIPIAFKFIEERDFESLKEIVNSDIYKVKRSNASVTPNPKYTNIDELSLETLKMIVDSYLALLGVPKDEIYDEEEQEELLSFDDFPEELY